MFLHVCFQYHRYWGHLPNAPLITSLPKETRKQESQWISLTCKSPSLFVLMCNSTGNSQNPRICYLRVVLCWICTPDQLTSMLSGEREGLIRPLSWVWKHTFYAQTVSQSIDGWLGWPAVFSWQKFACPYLMPSVDIAPGEQERKTVTPLLQREGGQHGTAELTDKKRPQFSSV